jgi:hypothetical protein
LEKKDMLTNNDINKFKQAIMDRFREVNAEKDHVLPQAWLIPYLSMNVVKHKDFFESAMQQLQTERLIEFQKQGKDHYQIKLTQQGEDYLYPNFNISDAKQKIRNDIFVKFKANQNKTMTFRWLNNQFGQLNPKEQRIFNDVIESIIREKLATTSLLENFLYLTKKGEKFMSDSIL